MASTQSRRRKTREPASRYREAAELAIEQLDWCINYLRQINKPKIARALQQNRDEIVSRARQR